MHFKIRFIFYGYNFINFTDILSYNKLATQSITYISQSSGASYAVDGNTATCTKQFAIGISAPYKTVWWKVDLGDVHNIYSISIFFKTYDGYGCNKTGVYGMNCNKLCPINCQNNLCNIENGSCFGCKPGWRDILCDKECIEGMYGLKCIQQCPGHCRDNVTCNHVTGHCDGGCDKGWTGALCDKECDDGTYGYDCLHNCSGHCLNDSPCIKQTGHCDMGCKPGYTNTDCSKECMLSYGDNCQYICDVHCINQTCDRINGSCLYGCKEGTQCGTDNVKHISSASSSNNLSVTVGILMSACILIIIGVVITILVLRQRSSRTMSNTRVHRVRFKSAPAAEESVNGENLSNYQELNFALQENPYQSMSR
uniref:EGF-like domain-containing protein n=1 Tax=Magallana gigas TaxID=29159 RepID=A0A8W8NS81_MAGGI